MKSGLVTELKFVSDEKVDLGKSFTEYFDQAGELTESVDCALVKVTTTPSGFKSYYARTATFGLKPGELVDPLIEKKSVFTGTGKRNKESYPFKKVTPETIVYYLEFLKQKNATLLTLAERERVNV